MRTLARVLPCLLALLLLGYSAFSTSDGGRSPTDASSSSSSPSLSSSSSSSFGRSGALDDARVFCLAVHKWSTVARDVTFAENLERMSTFCTTLVVAVTDVQSRTFLMFALMTLSERASAMTRFRVEVCDDGVLFVHACARRTFLYPAVQEDAYDYYLFIEDDIRVNAHQLARVASLRERVTECYPDFSSFEFGENAPRKMRFVVPYLPSVDVDAFPERLACSSSGELLVMFQRTYGAMTFMSRAEARAWLDDGFCERVNVSRSTRKRFDITDLSLPDNAIRSVSVCPDATLFTRSCFLLDPRSERFDASTQRFVFGADASHAVWHQGERYSHIMSRSNPSARLPVDEVATSARTYDEVQRSTCKSRAARDGRETYLTGGGESDSK